MKSKRLLSASALLGVLWFAIPLYAQAEGDSIEGDARQMDESAPADVYDAGIISRIKTALAINPITKDAKIHVNTDNGIVNLTGNVSNASVMQEAQEIARNAGHVKGVRNYLKVENTSNASLQM